MIKVLRLTLALFALVATCGASAAIPADMSLEECQSLVRDRPHDLDSYRCFWLVTRNQGLWAEAARALEALVSLDPSNHRARLYLAFVEADRNGPRAESLYRETVEQAAAADDPESEIHAILGLAYLLRFQGRADEAEPELERASRLAETTGDPILVARVRMSQSAQAMTRSDYGRALALLNEAENGCFPAGPGDLQSHILSAKGNAYWAMGLYASALDSYSREAELLHGMGDRYLEAAPRYNMALLAGRLTGVGQMEVDEYVRLIEDALETAAQVGHRPLEARSRLLLGQAVDGPRQVEQYERALAISRETGDRLLARQATRHLAEALSLQGPEHRAEAFRRVDEAIQDARAQGNREEIARGLCVRAWMSSRSADRQELIEDYLRAIEAVEKIRDLQPDGVVRARIFSQWTFPYYRFAGLLLDGLAASPDPTGDLELAFRTIERMRARVLLDELDSAGARPAASAGVDAYDRRAAVLHEMSLSQKRLVDRTLEADERVSLLGNLERLERDEAALRDEIARLDPFFARLRAPSFPALAEIQQQLDADQALLSFHLSTRKISSARQVNDGGSWLIVVTRDSARALPLPEKDALEEQIAVFLGLFERRDASESLAAGRLYADLLDEALREIDPSIRRLVIIPDGRLHRLPFSALRDERDEKRIAERYEISYAPSATVWAGWKRGGDIVSESRVLSLADPQLPAGDGDDPVRAANPWMEGLLLDPLVRARKEARDLGRALASGSHLFTGQEASERRLKETDLGPYVVLHLATHAVVDEERPARSAVLLTPGAGDEDGLLQPHEIVSLDLDGRVVILTGCRSASGTLVGGEGPLGLARAFFQAGARAVIGSLWAVRDDETELLMQRFSEQLAAGKSLAAAMADARRERIEAGAPAAAWAGLVVLGDGDAVLVPGGSPRANRTTAWVLTLAAAVLVATVVVLVARRSRRVG